MATGDEQSRRRGAVALAYCQGGHDQGETPRVVARGYGELADRIVAEARRHGIYVHESVELTALLMELELDSEIPSRLFEVIAELVLWLAEIQSDEEVV